MDPPTTVSEASGLKEVTDGDAGSDVELTGNGVVEFDLGVGLP